jgi:hypothetical protein
MEGSAHGAARTNRLGYMKHLWTLGWALLVTSIAVNVVLLARARPTSQPTRERFRGSEKLDNGAGSAIPSSSSNSSSFDSSHSNLSECLERLPAMEADAMQVSQKLRRVLPPHRIFQLGDPNGDAEVTFRPMVERVLYRDGGVGPTYALECRDIVCRLTIVEDNDAHVSNWAAAFQEDIDLRKHVTAMAFRGATSTDDLLTKTTLRQERIYLRLVDPDAGDVGMVR